MRTLVTLVVAVAAAAALVIAAELVFELAEARMERDDAPDLFESL